MKRTLHFAIVIFLVGFGTSALANSCIDWYSGKASYDRMLEVVFPEGRDHVLSLIKYQNEQATIEVHVSIGRRVPIRGKVTNLRLEEDNVLFDIGDVKINLENVDSILRLGILTDPKKILEYMSPSNREIFRTLIQAQQENGRVEINYPRNSGKGRGSISNVRIEDGRLAFDFEGKPFTGSIGDIRLLVVNRNPDYILGKVSPEKLEIAQTLLNAQHQNGSVEIRFTNGIAGTMKGSVSNFRIEDGYPIFDFNGKSEKLFHIGQVRSLVVMRNAEQILENVYPNAREVAQTLLDIQQQASAVEIQFTAGLSGRTQGVVSNFRIEDGLPLFEVSGKTYRLSNVGSIRKLVVIKNVEQILESVFPGEREMALTLLKVQSQGSRVEIRLANGIVGKIRGSISDFRIEDGRAVFNINGETRRLSNVGEITVIEGSY